MNYSKGKMIYSGKSKSLYGTQDPKMCIAEFRNDITAGNGAKHEQLAHKGELNNQINAYFMRILGEAGIATHFVQYINPTESLIKSLKMISLEAVVRNVAAGSLCRRLGLKLGEPLPHTLYELYYKSDALNDPLVSEDHALMMSWATQEQLDQMRRSSLKINEILSQKLSEHGLILVDAKFEFGILDNQIVLGDEISPDSCRIWDQVTGKILDKDRFRQDLGGVIEGYQELARRLKISQVPGVL